MYKILSILSLILLFHLPQQVLAQHINAPLINDSSSSKKQVITYRLIDTKDHTYGYDIFINGKLFIHQPVIPCMPGDKGLKTKADAKKLVRLVIEKVEKGLIPPTVTIPEMQKLGLDLR